MKEYKRLTNNNRDEYDAEYDFCCDCKYFGEPCGCNRPNGTCGNYDRFIETYNRLAELEDKIENRTLVEVESPCTEEFDYICKYYENGLCHLGGELFGVPPQLCHHINDFENCMGSKPAKREIEVKVKKNSFNEFDYIVINGIKFKKV